jgi:hypothetical protein
MIKVVSMWLLWRDILLVLGLLLLFTGLERLEHREEL